MKIGKTYTVWDRATALLLSVCMVLSAVCCAGMFVTVASAESGSVTGGATQNIIDRVSDKDTTDDYLNKLLTNANGSRYAGRIWTDKSVFAFKEGGDNRLSLNEKTDGYQSYVDFNADFLHVFSALASSQVINEYPPSPIDMVLVLDISSSMSKETEAKVEPYATLDEEGAIKHTRFMNLVYSANRVIENLMKDNPENRVSVVVYDRRATVVMPLAHYEANTTPVSELEPPDGTKKEDYVYDTKYLYDGTTNGDKHNNAIAHETLKDLVFGYLCPYFDGHSDEPVTVSQFRVVAKAKDETDAAGNPIKTQDVTSLLKLAGTNTHAGITAGLEQLANAKETTLTATLSNGVEKTVPRIPAAVIMTDGGSNTVANGPWYDPEYGTPVQRSDHKNAWSSVVVTQYLLTAAYLKSAVEKNYSEYMSINDGDGQDLPVYTVGVDLRTDSDDWVPSRLYPMMDPENYFKDKENVPQYADNPSASSGEIKLAADDDADPNSNEALIGTAYDNIQKWLESADSEVSTEFPVVETHKGALTGMFQQGEGSDNYPPYDYNHYVIPFEEYVEGAVPGSLRLWLRHSSGWYEPIEEFNVDYATSWHGWKEVEEDTTGKVGTHESVVTQPGNSSAPKFTEEIDGTATFYSFNEAYNADKTSGGYEAEYLKPREVTYDDTDDKIDNEEIRSVDAVTQEDIKSNINYVTHFYNVSSAQMDGIFEDILTAVLGKVFVPVSGDNDAGVSDSVTYQDPIGDYMEIKNGAVTATPYHVDGSVTATETTYDMAMLLFGEMHGLTRTGVYDFQWNDKYMKAHPGEGTQGKTALPMGWYKGDPETADYKQTLDPGMTSAQAWADGWVYRLNFETFLQYVPIADAANITEPQQLTEQQKNTVYTIYAFSCTKEDRNELRINPIYGSSVPEAAQSAYDAACTKDGEGNVTSYPVDNKSYAEFDGVYRLSDIRVWVEDYGDYRDSEGKIAAGSGYESSLYVNIPAPAVPTQLAEITLGPDGVLSYKTNLEEKEQSTPVRLFYAVGVKDDVKKNGSVNVSALSKEYIDSHTDPETGNIWFLSNYFSDTKYGGYAGTEPVSRGDAAATFSPSEDNRYYVFQSPRPLMTKAYYVKDDGTLREATDEELENGEYAGLYTDQAAFKAAYEKSQTEGEGKITDVDGTKYDVEPGSIVFLQEDFAESFTKEGSYYLIIEYYVPDLGTEGKDLDGETVEGTTGGHLVQRVVKRTYSDFEREGVANVNPEKTLCWVDKSGNAAPQDYSGGKKPDGDNWVLAAKAGGVRVNDMYGNISKKSGDPVEDSAETYYVPTVSENSGVGDDLVIDNYLGNNGRLSVANGKLAVTKTLTPPTGGTLGDEQINKTFQFELTLEGVLDTTVDAIKVQYNEYSRTWQRVVSSIDVLTDNGGLLLDNDDQRAMFDVSDTPIEDPDNEGEDAYTARLVVYGPNNALYYAKEDGTPGEPCLKSENQLYYLYLPNGEGGDTYSRRIYDGTPNMPENSGRTTFFNDGDREATLPTPGVRDTYRPATEDRPAGTQTYWALDAILIPSKTVNDAESVEGGAWTYTENKNTDRHMRNFTLVVDKPTDTLTDDSEITSPYKTRTQYETQQVEFKDGKATFTLSTGNGLLFTGIPQVKYSVTEVLTDEDTAAGYTFTDVVVNGDDDATKEEKTVSGTVTSKDEIRLDYHNSYDVGSLSIKKVLTAAEGTELNELDRNTEFEFTLSFDFKSAGTPGKGTDKFPYTIIDVDAEGNETVITKGHLLNKGITCEEGGDVDITVSETGTWTFHLKGGQTMRVDDLPVGTGYSYTVTEEAKDGYEVKDKESNTVTGTVAPNNKTPEVVTFTNEKQKPNPTKAQLQLEKTLTVADGQKFSAADKKFTFEVTPDGSNPTDDPIKSLEGWKDNKLTVEIGPFGETTETKTVDIFPADTQFGTAGTYKYTVREVQEEIGGVTFDPQVTHTVEITTEEEYKDGVYTGNLKVKEIKIDGKVVTDGDVKVSYNNSYDTEGVDVTFKAHKTLVDEANTDKKLQIAEDEFEFTISTEDKDAPLPSPATVKTTASETGEVDVFFKSVKFEKAGTYTYTIKETKKVEANDVTYDGTEWTVTVTVTDDGGQLKAEVKYTSGEKTADAAEFTNKKDTHGDLTINKTVSSTLADEESWKFTFTVQLSDDTFNGTVKAEYGNGTSTKVTFTGGKATVTLTKEQKNVTLKELPVGECTVTEESAPGYTVEGSSSQTVEVKPVGAAVSVSFTNEKTIPDSPTTELNVTKKLDESVAKNNYTFKYKAEDFSFKVVPGATNPDDDPIKSMPGCADGALIVKNGAPSNSGVSTAVVFPSGTPFGVGTYTYTITEVVPDPKLPGVSYDTSEYTVTIKVEEVLDENGIFTGELKLTKTVTKGGAAVDGVVFTNGYTPTPASAEFEAHKTFVDDDGSEAKLPIEEGEFTFELKAVTSGAPMPTTTKVTTPADPDGDVSVFFDEIEFTKPGTYVYTITETATNGDGVKEDGVTYDETEWTVTVTVTDDGKGSLSAKVEYKSGETTATKAEFTNGKTIPKFGKLTVTKTVSGDTENIDPNAEFTFTVYVELDGKPLNGEYGGVEYKDGKTTFTLKAGEHMTLEGLPAGAHYEVSEAEANSYVVGGNEDGYRTTVPVNAEGTIVGNAEGTPTVTVTFDNEKPYKGSLSVTKTVKGRDRDETVFTFEIVLEGEDADKVTGTYGQIEFNEGKATVTLKAGETKTATGLPSGLGYTVKETVPGGYTLETPTVGDTGTIPAGGTATAEFVNDYTPTSTSAEFKAHKSFVDDDGSGTKLPIPGDMFTFTVTAVTAGAPMPQFPTVTVPASETGAADVTFGSATYEMPGTYVYTIRETAGKDGDIKYDDTVWTVTVVVEDDGNGNLSVKSQTYAKADGTTAERAEFTNEKTIPKFGNLTVSKSVTGNADDDTVFTFKVTLSDKSINKEGTITRRGGETETFNIVNGEATFTLRSGDRATVTGLPAGVTYTVTETDSRGYTVSSEGSTGEIPANNTAQAAFTNVPPKPIDVEFKAHKTLVDKDDASKKLSISEGEFEFMISTEDKDAPLPDPATVTTPASGTGEVDVFFEHVTFTKTGTYVYKINEMAVGNDGMEYDGTEWIVTVVVTDENKDGQLEAKVTYTSKKAPDGADAAAFTNTKDTHGDLTINKTVNGTLADGESWKFTFTVQLSDSTFNGTVNAEYGNGSRGTVTFTGGKATVTLTKEQISVTLKELPVGSYTVTEEPAPGYTVKGSDSQTAEVKPVGDASVSFTNEKTIPDSPTTELNVTKKLDESVAKNKYTFKYKANDFSFKVVPGAANPANDPIKNMPGFADGALIVKNGAPSNSGVSTAVVFPSGTPFGVGTYTYTITEVVPDPKLPGVSYDTSEYTVTIKVEEVLDENGIFTGELKLTKTVTKGGETVEGVVFTNGYTPEPAKEQFEAHKTFIDDDGSETKLPIPGDTFTFTVTAVTAGAPMPDPAKVTVPASETGEADVTFGSVTFDKPGTYVYTITETPGDEEGVTYDRTVWTVTVTVTDDGEGNLTATVEYKSGDTTAARAEFTNEKTIPKTGNLTVKKTVSGDTEGIDPNTEFHFTVNVTVDGKPLTGTYGEFTFDEDGNTTFTLKAGETKTITGLPAGAHYKVSETEANSYVIGGNEDGYRTTVPVNAEGTIEGNAEGTPTVTVTFDNEKPYKGSLSVTKTVKGRDRDETVFTFEITLTGEGADKVTGTYGQITFNDGKATVTLKSGETKTATGLPSGLGYTVKETPIPGGYTPETPVGDTGTIPEGGTAEAKFVNDYTPKSTTTEFNAHKTFVDDDGSGTKLPIPGDVFTFTVTAVTAGAPMPQFPTVTVPASETGEADVTFGSVTFDKPGTYVYKITETPGDEDGVTYDGTVWTVTVTVADDGNGSLTATVEYKSGDTTAEQAEFTNEKTIPKFGNLTVSKTVTGKDNDTTVFTFDIVLDDGSINGKYGEIEFTDGKATVTLKSGESARAIGLPAGIGYTVTERDANGYTATYTGETGKIPANNTAQAAFTNAYTPNSTTAQFEAHKTFVDDDGSGTKLPIPGDTFTFTVTAVTAGAPMPDPAKVTVPASETGEADVTFGSVTFDKPGTYVYKITETPGDEDGVTYDETEWTVTVTVADDGEGNLEATVEYKSGDTTAARAGFTNEKTIPKTGNLTVKKTVSGDTESIDPNTEFHFTVNVTVEGKPLTGTYGEFTFDEDGNTTFTLKAGETKTITGLPAGAHYKVSEAEANSYVIGGNEDGYRTTVPVNAEGTIEGNAEGTPTVTVTFDNEKPFKGSLSVTKTVKGRDRDETVFTFEITLTGEGADKVTGKYGQIEFNEGKATVTLKSGETKTATGLPSGLHYTVKETPIPGGYTLETPTVGDTGTIPAGGTATAEFVNDYTPTSTSAEFKAHKTFVDDDGSEAKLPIPGDTFTFTVTAVTAGAPMPQFPTVTVPASETGEADVTFGSVTFDKPGTYVYTITETPGDEEGVTYDRTEWTVTVTVADDGEGNLGATVEYKSGDTTAARAEFTNEKTIPKFGNLTVSKIVTGSTEDDETEFTFTVTLSDTTVNGTFGEMTFTNGVAEFTLANGGHKSATGLPAGVTYTVTEAEHGGYTLATSTGVTGEIPANNTAEAVFTNERTTPPTGSLTVKKTVTGADGDKTKVFTFTVTLSDTTINGVYGGMTFTNGTATLHLRDGESKTATGLPAGITYTVVEVEADTAGYDTSAEGDRGTIPVDGEAVAEFTNHKETPPPTPETGSLTVRKTVSGNATSTQTRFAFTVTLTDKTVNGWYGEMFFENGVAEFTLRHNESATATGLPAGVGYTVEEEDLGDQGYTVTSEGDEGTIPGGGEAEAEFENHRHVDIPGPESGPLAVRKLVTGEEGELDREFHFTVTLSDRTINGKYGDMEFVNGVAEFTLKSGEVKWGRGIPVGTEYAVAEAEANTEGYDTIIEGEVGGIIRDVRSEVRFHNHRGPWEPDDDIPWEEIPDPDIPLADIPQTGDGTNTYLWFALLGISLGGMLLAIPDRRRRRAK